MIEFTVNQHLITKWHLIAFLSFAIFIGKAEADQAQGPAVKVVSQQLTFHYLANDGSVDLDCVHSQIRDMPDWEVVCGKGTALMKKFTVHFVTHEVFRAKDPQVTFEFLYWVTEWNQPKPIFNANSFWINLHDKTSLESIRLHQGVENNTSSLAVDYSP
jgi:hypothetical protein